ncbi:MAG TPA: molecular chaperone TorD family protein [Candidatus Dormibacteraeota bacterium]|nr:molecular chaperone TorD family protein [Candidatus Dormibacteraeota bacterium]
MELVQLGNASGRIAAVRSRTYQLLGAAFAFPDQDFFAAGRDGSFARAVAEACRGLPHGLGDFERLRIQDADGSYVDFESEYIRLFDLGPAGPPCPLYGGLYGGRDRMKVMEDATRFYNFFHLRLSSERRELPDHITTELEFLHYLTFREAQVCEAGGHAGSLWRAERDFLARHLCKWVPALCARVEKHATLPFFPALAGFAARFLDRDHHYAAAAAGSEVDDASM